MGETTEINWTDATFNPWWGCQRVSPGCEHCYAEAFDKRVGGAHWGPAKTTERRMFGDKHWAEPLKWNRDAEKAGQRRRVFCASMADVFESRVDLIKERTRLFDLIQQTPNLDWLLLTKRPENIGDLLRQCYLTSQHGATIEMLDEWLIGYPPHNVWIGTTVENQEYADKRIPALLRVPAVVRFLSCEPLLGPLEFSNVSRRSDAVQQLGKKALDGIHWVIVGGESGPGARPMDPEWARSIRDQCAAVGVPFHFKQWGEYKPARGAGRDDASIFFRGVHGVEFERVGKKAAGHLLDGVEHYAWPEVQL